MSDDLERQLDEFYRKLDGSARRVEARWKSTSTRSESRIAAWLGAGVAAAAAILLVISALRSEPKPPAEPVAVTAPPSAPERTPLPETRPPQPAPRTTPAEPPRPETPIPPRPPEPRPDPTPTPDPAPTPTPQPTPRPEPPKPEEPSPTKVTRAFAVLREADGAFDLSDKPLRGKQKGLRVNAGDRLRATAPVRITLADDRVVLLSPRTVVEFRPDDRRLSLALEQGDLIADLIGPGPEIHVVTKACDVTPLGTVFGVRVDGGRTVVTVEKGRVDVQSSKGKATLRPAESLQASEDGTIGAPVPADFRSMAWARNHRAAELTLLSEDFSKPGNWVAEVERGVARAVTKQGSGAVLQLAGDKGLFEVPVRGSISIVCRTDRANKFKVQVYSSDVKTTYTKHVQILRGDAWRTVVIDFDDLQPSDKSKPARLPAGSLVTDLLIMYGDEPGPGTFWVDSIKITEARP